MPRLPSFVIRTALLAAISGSQLVACNSISADADRAQCTPGKCDFPGQRLVIANAQLVDPSDRTVAPGSIVIENGVIVEVIRDSSHDAAKIFDGEIVDARGQWVIPTLFDMHAHTWGNPAPGAMPEVLLPGRSAKRALYAGVSSLLDLNSDEQLIFPARDLQSSDPLGGARIYAAGAMITCPGGHGTQFPHPVHIVEKPDEAIKAVEDLALLRPDVVKVVYDRAHVNDEHQPLKAMSHDTMVAVLSTARRLGLKTVVHIGTWTDAKEAILAEASAITHLDAAELPEDVVALAREKGVVMNPTIAATTELAQIVDHPERLASSLLRAVAGEPLVQAYAAIDLSNPNTSPFLVKWINTQRASRDSFGASLRQLAAAGIPIMAGTDSGNLGVFQGYSIHREMAAMVELGLSPWDALAAATSVPARFLGRRVGFTPGDEASFIVLRGSPIDAINNTEDIEAIFLNGQVVDRAALLEN